MPDPGFAAYDFMKLTGLLAFASAWSHMERTADASPDPEELRKQATFVRDYMLPETAHLQRTIEVSLK